MYQLLKNYFNNNQNTDVTPTDKNKDSTANEKTNDWYLDLSRVTLLVQFVEYLEKNIYNAYEGTAVSIAQPPLKAIKIFFRTNKSTCIDWFARVRYLIIHISIKSGHYEIAIRQSYDYIQHTIKNNLTSVNKFIKKT